MKLFKHKSLMGLLYAVLLAIPLVSIISRVIYVQSNKNAYQSYSYEKNLTQVLDITNTNNLVQNNTYYFSLLDNNETNTSTYTGLLKFIETNLLDLIATFDTTDYTNVNGFSIGYLPGYFSKNTLTLWSNSTMVKYWRIGIDQTQYINTDLLHNIYFIFDEKTTSDYTVIPQWSIQQYLFNNKGSLDNVFEYSVDSIIKDNNFGNIDFLSWFSNMFLDNNNSVNNRYVHFANWYLNYVMFISCVYLLFLVLMWFINFARRLLDRGMNYDW